jgi:hypothetical protein
MPIHSQFYRHFKRSFFTNSLAPHKFKVKPQVPKKSALTRYRTWEHSRVCLWQLEGHTLIQFEGSRVSPKQGVCVCASRAWVLLGIYSARRLMGSRIIKSATYCNLVLPAQLYIDRAQNVSVNWIIRWLFSLLCRPEVILLSGGHCIKSKVVF